MPTLNLSIRVGLALMGTESQQMKRRWGRGRTLCLQYGLYENGVTLRGLECSRGTLLIVIARKSVVWFIKSET